MRFRKLINQVRRFSKRVAERALGNRYAKYASDPVAYCRDVLQVRLTQQQEELAGLVLVPPFRVLAPAGHNVGKSFLAACLVNWWYDVNDPGLVLTTAPTDRQVKRILWKEVRLVRGKRGGFPGPKAPLLWSAENHFAEGFTARDASRFQGQHGPAVFIVFDEAEGVDQEFWEAAETMLGGSRYAFFGIYNPTSQSGPTVDAERSGRYHLRRLSCVDHPNIVAESHGGQAPCPSAIRLGRLVEMLSDWSEEVSPERYQQGDVLIAGRCFRPGPVAQARLLGLRPTQAFNAVWSESVFDLAAARVLPVAGRPQIGCDVARFGDDFTAFHVQRNGTSLYHESVNGWDTVQTTNRCKWLATEWGQKCGCDPRSVTIAVDVCGVGAGVVDALKADRWSVVGVNVAEMAGDGTEYPNLRSAMWFGLAIEAARGNVSFAGLTDRLRAELRRQLLAPLYRLDLRGRRVVESKDETKARIKRSPDDADAVMLAYANVRHVADRVSGRVIVPG